MGKGSKAKSPKIQQTELLTPEQKALLGQLTGALGGTMFGTQTPWLPTQPSYLPPTTVMPASSTSTLLPATTLPSDSTPSPSSYQDMYDKIKHSMPYLSDSEIQKRAQIMVSNPANPVPANNISPEATAPPPPLAGVSPYPYQYTPGAMPMQQKGFNIIEDMLSRPSDYLYTGKDVYNKYAGYGPSAMASGPQAWSQLAASAPSVPQAGTAAYNTYLQSLGQSPSFATKGKDIYSQLGIPSDNNIPSGVSAFRTGAAEAPSPWAAGTGIAGEALSQAQKPYSLGMNALESILKPYDPSNTLKAFEPVRQAALTGWKEDILPQLREDYVAAGGYRSGGRERSELESGRRLEESLSAQLGNMIQPEYSSHMNRMLSAVPQAQSFMGAPLSTMSQAMRLGQAEVAGQLPTAEIIGNLGALGGGEQRAWADTLANLGSRDAEIELQRLRTMQSMGLGNVGEQRADITSMFGLGQKLGNEQWGNINSLMNLGLQNLGSLQSMIGTGLQAGAGQRDIASQLLAEPYQKWQYSQPYSSPYLPWLQTALGIKATQPYMLPGVQRQPGMFESMLTGLAPGIGYGLGGLFK